MIANIWAVVPAGGVGARMNAPMAKQYLPLLGQPVMLHTLTRLCALPEVHNVVVGVADDDVQWQGLGFQHDKLKGVVCAGAQRVDTVLNCLRYIIEQGGSEDWALVHDAARPCVRSADIQALIKTVTDNNEGGILALPVSDTLKRAMLRSGKTKLEQTDTEKIEQTVSRNGLWRAMTPQLFKVSELKQSIEQAMNKGVLITDEASAMEAAGYSPLLIPCSPDNIKITLPEDMQFAEMILDRQTQQGIT
ncbi:MAG: 2-C-methyl-D-erythritol 4-phosphate cytidylyltransferase [Arenicellales bacterium]